MPASSSSSISGGPLPGLTQYAPTCDCCCDCYNGDGGAGGPTSGSVSISNTRIGGNGFLFDLNPESKYSNRGAGAFTAGGKNWMPHTLAGLVPNGGDWIHGAGPEQMEYFAADGNGGFVPRYYVRSKLVEEGDGSFTLYEPDGGSKRFDSGGKLTAIRNANGDSAAVGYAGGLPDTVEVTDGTGTAIYQYAWSGTLLQGVTFILDPDGTDPGVRRVAYSYYAGDAGGSNLEKAVIEEWNGSLWVEVSTRYFRYHDGTDSPAANNGLLRLVLGDNAYRQALSGLGVGGLDAVDTADLVPYADREFAYDAYDQVSEEWRHGGKYLTSYDYYYKETPPTDLNHWAGRTTVTRPDGTTLEKYYFNFAGQVILRQVIDGAETWNDYCQRFEDVTARVALKAMNSAIASVSEANPELVTLEDDAGLVRLYEYDGTAGLISAEYLQRGDNAGSKVKLRALTYAAKTVGGHAIYKVATETVYREASSSGSGPITTSKAYLYHGSGFQVSKVTTTLPVVVAMENGSGAAATAEEHYDGWGYLTKTVNETGVETTFEFDRLRGGMTRMFEDAGTGGMQLRTDYEVDDLGRQTRKLGPAHAVDLGGAGAETVRTGQWTHYRDAEDEVVTIRGYAKVDGGGAVTSEHTVNPVRISRSYENDPQVTGGRMTSEIAAVYAGAGIPAASQSYARSAWRRWSDSHFDKGGELTASRVYHEIPVTGSGAKGTNYAETLYGYDTLGRQNQVTSPEGTIKKRTFNAPGWLLQVDVGTTAGNQKTVEKRAYGNPAGLDGMPSEVRRPVDGTSGNDRVTEYGYDWRDRPTDTTVNDGTRDYITETTYDNLDRETESATYHDSVGGGNLITKSTSAFDGRGRVYRTKRYPDTGLEANALVGKSWYDEAGNIIREEPAGSGAFTVVEYDALNRATAAYTGYVPSSGSSSSSGAYDPQDISGAVIVEQSETEYDAAGNAIKATSRERMDNATGPGPLGTPSSTEPRARVSFGASYPDGIGRTKATVNVGTNGGTVPWPRPAQIPARSDGDLVTTLAYDSAGDQVSVTDPMGTVTRREFDDAGRLVRLTENHLEFSSSSSSSSGSGPDCFTRNRVTRYEYNDDNNMTKLVAENPTTGNQETTWVYGVTEGGGSAINSNALVWKKVYPPGATGGGTPTATYRYNRQGQAVKFTDQAGTVHDYTFDGLGRPTSDHASTLGTGIDDTVNRITREYDDHLRLHIVKSLHVPSAGPETTDNIVTFGYNAFGQLASDGQDHAGSGSGKTVAYAYANGSANTIRRVSMTYPSAVAATYGYDTEAADKLGRVDAIRLAGTEKASYAYLGISTPVKVTYAMPGASPDITMEYLNASPQNPGGDQYTGLDRFGRVVGIKWASAAPETLVDVAYGYDRAGNRTWRRDNKAHSLGGAEQDKHDLFHDYDGFYQVTESQRGNLTGTAPNYTGITSVQRAEDWCYDATGNWQEYVDDLPGSGSDLAQLRTHNKANEVTSFSAPGTVPTPAYDAVGNMTSAPTPTSWNTAYTLKWDAWNRLVEVKAGLTVVQENRYDGLTRRITEDDGTNVRHFYYNDQWRSVEEYLGSAGTPERRHLWGARSRWDMILRQRNDTGSLDEELNVLYDAMDPVAIVDDSSAVVERMEYTTFGQTAFLDASFVPAADTRQWNWLFHGEFRDGATGLYNYGFRYYQDRMGRWLSRDPLEEVSGKEYTMTSNNPVIYIDEIGLMEVRYFFTTPYDVTIEDLPGRRVGVPAGRTEFDGVVSCICLGCTVTCTVVAYSSILMNITMNPNGTDGYRMTLIHEKRHVMSWACKVKEKIVGPLIGEKCRYDSFEECQEAAAEIQERYSASVHCLRSSGDHRGDPGASKYSPVKGMMMGIEVRLKEWEADMMRGSSAGTVNPVGHLEFGECPC